MPFLPLLFFPPCNKFCKEILVSEKCTQNTQVSSSFFSDYVFLKNSNTHILKYLVTQNPVSTVTSMGITDFVALHSLMAINHQTFA